MFRRFSFFIFLIAANLPAAAVAEQFATQVVTDLRTMLHETAMLDPVTGREDKTRRRQIQKRQKELHRWFVARGRIVSRASCKTDADLKNYEDFRETMATFDLLRLSETKRRRFIRTVMKAYDEMPGVFAASISRLSAGSQKAEALILAQCKTPVRIEPRFFGMGVTTIGALYFPPRHTIYVNLNYLINDPHAFADALDHELWHHLLVSPSPSEWTNNLWWEGFTEFAAEQWRWQLGELQSSLRLQGRAHVDYPVLTATASIAYARSPEQALLFAAGQPDAGDFLIVTGALLQERLPRLLTRLNAWGWKEDDQSPLTLSRLKQDGHLFPDDAIVQMVRRDKRLFRDFMRAMTVEVMPKEAGAGEARLAPDLRENCQETRKFCRTPTTEYGKEP